MYMPGATTAGPYKSYVGVFRILRAKVSHRHGVRPHTRARTNGLYFCKVVSLYRSHPPRGGRWLTDRGEDNKQKYGENSNKQQKSFT